MPFRIRISLAIVLGLLTLVFIGPLITPVRPLTDTLPIEDLLDADSQFVELNDLKVHYKTAGDPNADLSFVLIHGFGASTYTWHELMPELAELGFVVAFDRPAFGFTERPLQDDWSENPYGNEAQRELSLKLMDTLGIDKAILVGHSSGSALALDLALEHNERVSGLVLLDATIYDGGGVPPALRFILHSPQMNRIGPLLMRQFDKKPGREFLENAWSNPDLIGEDTFEAYQKPRQINDWDKALWEFSKASRNPNLTDRLANISQASLILTGADDQLVPEQFSEQLSNDLNNADFASFANCGHMPQEECPQDVMQSLNEWLERQEYD